MKKPSSQWKIWLVAVRPFAYPASAIPVLLGAALAWNAEVPFLWGRFALALFGVLLFHTAANLLNDCFDFRRGTDAGPNPDSGAVVRGWITDSQAFRAALLCACLGMVCGFLLVRLAGWMILYLGILGGVLALGYTRGGMCWKYAGLGDLAVFIAFGVLPAFGAYWVQAETFAWDPLLWSIPPAAITVGILHANNWRDMKTDSAHRCRTFAGLLGERGSRRYYRLLVLGPFALTVAYLILGRLIGLPRHAPWALSAVFIAFPAALKLARRHPGEFDMQVAHTARLQMMFGCLLIAGFVFRVLFCIRWN